MCLISMLDIVYQDTERAAQSPLGARRRLPANPRSPHGARAGIPLYGIDPENHFFGNWRIPAISLFPPKTYRAGKCGKICTESRLGRSPAERRRVHRGVPELQQIGIQ